MTRGHASVSPSDPLRRRCMPSMRKWLQTRCRYYAGNGTLPSLVRPARRRRRPRTRLPASVQSSVSLLFIGSTRAFTVDPFVSPAAAVRPYMLYEVPYALAPPRRTSAFGSRPASSSTGNQGYPRYVRARLADKATPHAGLHLPEMMVQESPENFDKGALLNEENDGTEEEPEVVGLIGHFEAADLLARRGELGPFTGSLDMGMTLRDLMSTEEGVALPVGHSEEACLVVTWDELAVILKKVKKGQYGCWELFGDGCTSPAKVSDISESTNRPAMLCAPVRVPGPPTMVLGGFSMHRISGGDQKSTMEPKLDTGLKVSASGARKATGRVLDTCTGLGYTAIAAAGCKGVTRVTTVEIDEVSLRMCARNPWSRRLFEDDNIDILRGDCCELIKDFEDEVFSAVIHDPPARALCKSTDMYGSAFYHDLARVLKPGGTLFHYIGNPASTESGRLFRGVITRLIEAGFRDCRTDKDAFGVVARR